MEAGQLAYHYILLEASPSPQDLSYPPSTHPSGGFESFRRLYVVDNYMAEPATHTPNCSRIFVLTWGGRIGDSVWNCLSAMEFSRLYGRDCFVHYY